MTNILNIAIAYYPIVFVLFFVVLIVVSYTKHAHEPTPNCRFCSIDKYLSRDVKNTRTRDVVDALETEDIEYRGVEDSNKRRYLTAKEMGEFARENKPIPVHFLK